MQKLKALKTTKNHNFDLLPHTLHLLSLCLHLAHYVYIQQQTREILWANNENAE